ncbi:MAG: bifunctional lysylphosphatidylglycerol flippase/synthetase MprF [Deltaproteobacteria bacterium]|nr:bifunctional lysylphosphatidylglycerol flippase/synthetase MprF [Deltaproteobacteria bacterium]
MAKDIFRRLSPFIAILLFSAALWILHHELVKYRLHDIMLELKSIQFKRLLLAFLFTVGNYFVLSGFDALAMSYVRRRLPYSKIALASFIAYSFSHNIGLSLLSGGSVRYYLYTSWGFSAVEVANVIAFCGVTFVLGLIFLGGMVVTFEPHIIPATLYPEFFTFRPFGVLLLLITAAYMLLSVVKIKNLKIKGWEFRMPGPLLSFGQIAVSSLDWVMVASIIYVLLPPSPELYFVEFLGIFLIANFAGLMSHIPGGLGVFETVIIFFLSPVIPSASVVTALILFRAIYYLLPFMFSLTLFGSFELIRRRESLKLVTAKFGAFEELIPHFLTYAAFACGALLIFSGSIPPHSTKMELLSNYIPAAVIELSHILASVAGLCLILLSRSLQRRLKKAYFAAILFLAAGIILSLLKGLDYPEAVFLSLTLLVFIPSRALFYRKASVLREPFTSGWITAILIVLIGSMWLGFFSFEDTRFSPALLLDFSYEATAARSFRSTLSIILGVIIFSLIKIFLAAPKMPGLPDKKDLELADAIITQNASVLSRLVFSGDKPVIFNDRRTGFIMFGMSRRTWAALGDPVGVKNELSELAWKFYELADIHGSTAVFYNVTGKHLNLYSDLGLTSIKIGEEAKIPLTGFSEIEAKNSGLTCEIISPEKLIGILPELKKITDEFAKRFEKGFSSGFFNEEYLRQNTIAVLYRGTEIAAYANILTAQKEAQIDFIRSTSKISEHDLYFFISEIARHFKEKRFENLSLGTIYSFDTDSTALGPLWEKTSTAVYTLGEHFTDFKMLRAFADKFSPALSPRYLAYPGSFKLPAILTDIAALIMKQ